MRALVFSDSGPRLDFHYPKPQPAPHEALIRVRLAGVCSTDLQLLAGYKHGYRGVLGHEFVGQVEDSPTHPEWIGRRVVGELNIGCGSCALCARGLGKHCRQRQSLGIVNRDGAFAEYLTLPVANLHCIPDHLSDEQAVFVEPLAAALQILEQCHVQPGQRVYVLGDGRLGLLVAQVLARTACDLTALGRTAGKLAILAERKIPTARTDNPLHLAQIAQQPADLVVEVTGDPDGFALARRLVRPGGILALKSTFAGDMPSFDISGLVVDEITLLGSRCGPFAPAIRLLSSDAITVQPLIHARYKLDDGLTALSHAGQPGVLKVLIQP